jgi:hypothetical protein
MVGIFEGEFGQALEAMLVITTVEGRESSASYELIDGVPTYCAKPIAYRSKPNLGVLVSLLRSDRPLSDELRNWIADMLDERSDYHLKLSAKQNKSGGPKKTKMEYYWAVVAFMSEREKYGFDSAVSKVCAEFKIGKTTLVGAWRKLEPDILEDRRLKAENRQVQGKS